ncbi:uncharacterized protein LOC115342141 [Aquila chrysaetos chrysaetos]|uniref:uncharacterized protein LOC115342141 n=1 Tax=Aquila chrysaetos chrysaetos TaxID=223781 RepID=UPI001B7D2C1E|nr:uncharacterized protein LOC115342141 [Aquila chrysaetos chrysaetos]
MQMAACFPTITLISQLVRLSRDAQTLLEMIPSPLRRPGGGRRGRARRGLRGPEEPVARSVTAKGSGQGPAPRADIALPPGALATRLLAAGARNALGPGSSPAGCHSDAGRAASRRRWPFKAVLGGPREAGSAPPGALAFASSRTLCVAGFSARAEPQRSYSPERQPRVVTLALGASVPEVAGPEDCSAGCSSSLYYERDIFSNNKIVQQYRSCKDETSWTVRSQDHFTSIRSPRCKQKKPEQVPAC